MGSTELIRGMLERCSSEETVFPPTILYNEGWMLRLVLEWFSQRSISEHPLCFPNKAKWYSEALLPSAFLARYRGDKYAEAWTHADGVIGHFQIGRDRDGDLTLLADATTFKVVEAKMFSKLSAGTTHARYYNQAARNIACIAEVLNRAGKKPSELQCLAFYVVAPRLAIDGGVFDKYMSAESVKSTVKKRAEEYDESKSNWFEEWFLPTLIRIDIQTISWEDILSYVTEMDSLSALELKKFYERCKKYNRSTSTRIAT